MSEPPGMFHLGIRLAALPAGWPPDVAPGQTIFATHINNIRSSVAQWPGDVDGQNHWLRNVHLENATGVMTDPTTAPGDLIARDAAGIVRFPVGGNGQVLTADTSLPGKLKWAALVGQVASVFGRAGAVTAAAGDYTAAQVTNALSDQGVYANPPWLTALAWGKITGAPATFTPSPHTHDAAEVVTGRFAAARLGNGVADSTVYLRGDGNWAAVAGGGGGGVSSVFGRAGAVIAQTGDYSAAQVTGAVIDVTTARGDLLARTATAIVRLPAGADGQALISDAASPAGLRWAVVGGGGITDPTTTKGDLIVRGAAALTRLGVGADGQVLVADAASGSGIKWAAAAGGGAVSSVFTRTGAVVAAAGDYTAAQVLNALSDLNTYNNPSWLTGLAWSKIIGAPAFIADPTTTKGDLLVRGPGAVGRLGVGSDGQVLVADAASPSGIKWATGGGASQTPWLSDIDAATFKLTNVSQIGIGTTSPQGPLHVQNTGFPQLILSNTATDLYKIGRNSSTGYLDFVGTQGSTFVGYTFTINTSTEVMRITAAGNVGIGTTNPGHQFQVAGTGFFETSTTPYDPGNGVGPGTRIGYYQAGDFGYINANNTGVSGKNLILQPGGGNVGIGGVAAPVYGLDVWGTVGVRSDLTIHTGALKDAAVTRQILMQSNDGAAPLQAFIQLISNATPALRRLSISCVDQGVAWRNITFCETSGYVGIGTTTPSAQLTVVPQTDTGSHTTVNHVRLGEAGNLANYGLFMGYYPDVTNGNYRGVIQAKINGAGGPLMINAQGGAVGIAKLTPVYALDVGGDVNCAGSFRINGVAILPGGVVVQAGGTAVGTSTPQPKLNFTSGTNSNPSVTEDSANSRYNVAFNFTSDIRIKQNVRDLEGGLAVIERLRPVSFEYNGASGYEQGKRSVAAVAQELQEVLPDCVYTAQYKLWPNDQTYTDLLCYDPMQVLWHLVLAVKQLQKQLQDRRN